MAKTFIQEGTGSSAQLVNAQDEKIPIYDTEQDAEADFANIAEGQIYFTKEDKFDVDDMKDYIRKQNVLSELELVTTIPISTSSSTPSGNTYEAEFDGFIIYSVQRGTSDEYFYALVSCDNGVTWNKLPIVIKSTTTRGGVSITIPVSQGDKVAFYLNGSSSVGSEDYMYTRYYKLRDYSDR